MILISCVNKQDPDQHMQLLSLISIIDVRCIDKEVLHAYLLNSLFLDSYSILMSKFVWVMSGHIPQIIYHR